jgi:glycosyltransferase involved in cell wall biosynthesis
MMHKKSTRSGQRRGLLLSSNSLWNIENFRRNLVDAFVREGWSVLIAAPSTAEQMQACTLPARLVSLNVQRSGTNPLRDFALIRTYYSLLRAERPAAFLGWTIKPNLYGAIAARIAGVPSIVNVSGLGTAFLSGRLLSRFVSILYKLAFQRASIVFFQNSDDRAMFLERGLIRAEQARLLPGSGINLTHFPMTPMPHNGPIRFLMVARLLGDKGVREYVAAARVARRVVPGAQFQLLGPIDQGNRTSISSEEVNRWVSEGAIDYLGETSDVRPYIASATAVVLPSYREGLPRTLLEAASMGRPLIATDVAGCREVVEDGKNGFLCAAHDAQSLCAAMVKLARLDDNSLKKMGQRSRQMVEDRFSEELVAQAYVLALAEL